MGRRNGDRSLPGAHRRLGAKLILIAALTGGSLVASQSPASADGTCFFGNPSLSYAYAYCSGAHDTGLVRVTVYKCNSRGCYATSGDWVSKSGGRRSEVRVGSGWSVHKRGVGYEIQSP